VSATILAAMPSAINCASNTLADGASGASVKQHQGSSFIGAYLLDTSISEEIRFGFGTELDISWRCFILRNRLHSQHPRGTGCELDRPVVPSPFGLLPYISSPPNLRCFTSHTQTAWRKGGGEPEHLCLNQGLGAPGAREIPG
jgi:hypothetical protein